MIAAASLHRDLMLLAEAITDPNTDMMLFEGEQGAVLKPFPTMDWDIGNAFSAEFSRDGSAVWPNNISDMGNERQR